MLSYMTTHVKELSCKTGDVALFWRKNGATSPVLPVLRFLDRPLSVHVHVQGLKISSISLDLQLGS